MPRVGDVAGGEHVRAPTSGASRRRRPRCRPSRPASRASPTRGTHADADDGEVALDHAAAARAYARDRAVALEATRRPRRAPARRRAGVDVAIEGADLASRRCARSGSASGSMTVTSSPRWRAEAANSLPIQPRPDDHDAGAAIKPRTQHVAVGQGAQVRGRRRALRPGSGSAAARRRWPAAAGHSRSARAVVERDPATRRDRSRSRSCPCNSSISCCA